MGYFLQFCFKYDEKTSLLMFFFHKIDFSPLIVHVYYMVGVSWVGRVSCVTSVSLTPAVSTEPATPSPGSVNVNPDGEASSATKVTTKYPFSPGKTDCLCTGNGASF